MSFLGPEVVNYWQPSKAKPSKKRIRRGKTVGKTLPEDIAQPLSEANLCYISGDYTRAIELLSTVTSLAPRLADPYYTMGMIYYHYENYLQSLQFFVIAASYTPKTKMWILVALLAASLKQWNQGIEAIIRYSKIESNSYLQSLRILLNLEKKQYTYSRSLLGKYLESFPNDIAFLIEYGDTLYVKHVYDKALNAYVQYVCYIIGTDNITNEKEKLLRTCSICLSTPCKSFFLESYTNAINACLDPTIEVTHDNDCKTCQEYIELYFYCIHQIYIILIERYHDLEQMITQTDAVIAMFQTIPKSDRDNRLLNSDGIIHEIMKIDLNRALNEVNIIANAILIAVQSFESQLNDLHASLTKWITPQQMSQHENFLGSPPVSPFDVNMLKNIMLLTSGDDDEVNGSIHHLRSCLVVLDEESKIAVVDSTGAGYTDPITGYGGYTHDSNTTDYDHTTASFNYYSFHLNEYNEQDLNLESYYCRKKLPSSYEAMEKDYLILRCLLYMIKRLFDYGRKKFALKILQQFLHHFNRKSLFLLSLKQLSNVYYLLGNILFMFDISDTLNISGETDGMSFYKKAITSDVENTRAIFNMGIKALESHVSGGLDYQFGHLRHQNEINYTLSCFHSHFNILVGEFIKSSSMESTTSKSVAFRTNADITYHQPHANTSTDEKPLIVPNPKDIVLPESDSDSSSENSDVSNDDETMAQSHEDMRTFTVKNLELELRLLMLWGIYARHHNNKLTYLAIILPILYSYFHNYHQLNEEIELNLKERRKESLNTLDGNDEDVNTSSKATKKYVRLNWVPEVTMRDLIQSKSNSEFTHKSCFGEFHNQLWRFVAAVAENLSIEQIFGQENLNMSCSDVESILIELNMNEVFNNFIQNKSVYEDFSSGFMKLTIPEKMNAIIRRKRQRPFLDNIYNGSKRTRGVNSRTLGEDTGNIDDSDIHELYGVYDKEYGEVLQKLLLSSSGEESIFEHGIISTVSRETSHPNVLQIVHDHHSATRKLLEPEKIILNAASEISKAVTDAALHYILNPHSISAINTLFRTLLHEKETIGIGRYAIEKCLPVQRFYTLHPKGNIITCLLAAHEYLTKRMYCEALNLYIDAYIIDPQQPLVLLCLTMCLIFMSEHLLIKKRHEVFVKGFVSLHQYQNIRRRSFARHVQTRSQDRIHIPSSNDDIEELTMEAVEQEIYYNYGRVYDELKLYHLAVDRYNQALRLADQHPRLQSGILNVTRQAAHNLILIYKKAKSLDLAYEIMLKYLTF